MTLHSVRLRTSWQSQLAVCTKRQREPLTLSSLGARHSIDVDGQSKSYSKIRSNKNRNPIRTMKASLLLLINAFEFILGNPKI